MCLLLKEKSPSNKDEIGFFPCIAVHAAPLLSWTVSGHSQERGDGSSRFVCSGKAASQGMLDVQGQAQRLKVKLRLSVHLVSPLAPATLVPFGLMGSRSCWEHCKAAQTLLPIPSSRDAPLVMVCPHGIACARLSSSLWSWKVSQQPGVEAPATQLCHGRGPAWWVHDGNNGSH